MSSLFAKDVKRRLYEQMDHKPGIRRQLSRIEENLENAIQSERTKPRSNLEGFRKAGSVLTHSKWMLLLVVVLNCLDCILVLSELLLDVYFIGDIMDVRDTIKGIVADIGGMIDTAEDTMETFNRMMQQKYPEYFANQSVHDTHYFYNVILQSTLIFDTNRSFSYGTGISTMKRYVENVQGDYTSVTNVVNMTTESFDDEDDPAFLEDLTESTEEYISHAFHKASIVILSILVTFTLFKIFCEGCHFLKHKLEMFDALVVAVSFTLDLCYIRGLTNYRAESFILILVIMIPWRIIRVLNSLVIAVKDNFHFMLKIMYKRSKLQGARIEELETMNMTKESYIASLVHICTVNGMSISEINATFGRNVDSVEQKQLGANMFGACFGFLRHESTDADTSTENWEIKPLKEKQPEG